MEPSPTSKVELESAPSTKEISPQPRKGKKRKNNLCFIISPFGGWFDRYFEEIYQPAARDAGLVARRADDLYRPSAIVNDIWTLVKEARLLLADLSDKNPNVFYELGLAHAIGKPVVLLTRSMEDVPFDLRSLRVIEYEVEDPEWSALLRISITKAIQEVLDAPGLSVLPTFLSSTPDAKTKVKGTSLEKRLAALELSVNRLDARNRSLPIRYRERRLEPDEARQLIRDYVERGLPIGAIVESLEARGAPTQWVLQHIHELRYRSKRRTKEKPDRGRSKKKR